MSCAKCNSPSAALAIIDQRVEALEERLRDVQERIKELRQIREAVLQDLGTTSAEEMGHDVSASEDWAAADRRRPNARKLREWLTAHGPATRSEIRDNTGLLSGTIHKYLSPKFGFVLVDRGLGDITRQLTGAEVAVELPATTGECAETDRESRSSG
jgi:hypothetical protein